VAFDQQVIAAPAEITDADVERLHEHGYSDEQIAEVVGIVSLMLLTGAFNLAAGIELSTNAKSAA
jgi:alkylhydroperoxidase family enzyme